MALDVRLRICPPFSEDGEDGLPVRAPVGVFAALAAAAVVADDDLLVFHPYAVLPRGVAALVGALVRARAPEKRKKERVKY